MGLVKTCPNCLELKSHDDFYKNKKRYDGLNGWCKKCHRGAIADWKSRHVEQTATVNKKWNRENAAWIRSRERFRKYGLTPADFE